MQGIEATGGNREKDETDECGNGHFRDWPQFAPHCFVGQKNPAGCRVPSCTLWTYVHSEHKPSHRTDLQLLVNSQDLSQAEVRIGPFFAYLSAEWRIFILRNTTVVCGHVGGKGLAPVERHCNQDILEGVRSGNQVLENNLAQTQLRSEPRKDVIFRQSHWRLDKSFGV